MFKTWSVYLNSTPNWRLKWRKKKPKRQYSKKEIQQNTESDIIIPTYTINIKHAVSVWRYTVYTRRSYKLKPFLKYTLTHKKKGCKFIFYIFYYFLAVINHIFLNSIKVLTNISICVHMCDVHTHTSYCSILVSLTEARYKLAFNRYVWIQLYIPTRSGRLMFLCCFHRRLYRYFMNLCWNLNRYFILS